MHPKTETDHEALGNAPSGTTTLAVELDDSVIGRLPRRAEREGVEPPELAARIIAAAEPDPLDFVSSFASDAVAARDADACLAEHGFGQS